LFIRPGSFADSGGRRRWDEDGDRTSVGGLGGGGGGGVRRQHGSDRSRAATDAGAYVRSRVLRSPAEAAGASCALARGNLQRRWLPAEDGRVVGYRIGWMDWGGTPPAETALLLGARYSYSAAARVATERGHWWPMVASVS
jgi:hypothetical protein